jgi:hypothetical protein
VNLSAPGDGWSALACLTDLGPTPWVEARNDRIAVRLDWSATPGPSPGPGSRPAATAPPPGSAAAAASASSPAPPGPPPASPAQRPPALPSSPSRPARRDTRACPFASSSPEGPIHADRLRRLLLLRHAEVTTAADGSQDALVVRIAAGGHVGWGECEASPLPSIAAWVTPMSHGACQPVSASVLGRTLDGPEDIARMAADVAYNSMDLLQAAHTWSGVEIALWDLLGAPAASRSGASWAMSAPTPSSPTPPSSSARPRRRPRPAPAPSARRASAPPSSAGPPSARTSPGRPPPRRRPRGPG